MTEIKFRAASGKTHTLAYSVTRLNSGKHTCFMKIVETGKSVQGGGSNEREAYNNALAKIRA